MKPQVLVKLKNGEDVIYDVTGYEDFEKLVDLVCGLWSRWIYIGQHSLVKKSNIFGVFFLKDGYQGRG